MKNLFFSKTNLKKNIDNKRKALMAVMYSFVLAFICAAIVNPETVFGLLSVGGSALAIAPFLFIRNLDPGTGGGGETEDQKKEREALEKIQKATNDAIDKKFEGMKNIPAEFASLKESVEKAAKLSDLDNLKEALNKLGLDLKALKETPVLHNAKVKTFRDAIKIQLKSFMDSNKDKFEGLKKNKNAAIEFELDVKAAITMLESASVGGSAYLPKPQILPGYVDLVRNQPLIEQYANGGSISSAFLVWVDKYNAQGNAAITAEGAAKPLISFELKSETSTARKVAAKEKISTEMLMDIDFMASMIEQELMYQVNIATDNQLLTGDGTGSNLKGICTYAGGYVNTSITTPNANNFDAIRAAIGQMKALNFNPTHVFFNPLDAANMDLVKDTLGRVLAKEYKDANGNIFRVMPVESNQIAVGKFLLADMTKFFVWNYLPFTIQYGWENDDFTKNLVTVVGERRLHDYISTNHTGAFIYDTFANVKAALQPTP